MEKGAWQLRIYWHSAHGFIKSVWLYLSWFTKLGAYGLDETSLHFLRDYLSNQKQRTKIGSSFSDWWDIACGIPQGLILGPLMFDMFINDMLFFVSKSDVYSFADDNTLSSCRNISGEILLNLKFDWGHILK